MQTIIELHKYSNYIDNLNNFFILDIKSQQNSIIKNIKLVLTFAEDLEKYPNIENLGYDIIKYVKLTIGKTILAYETGDQYRILDIINPYVIPKIDGNKMYIPLFTTTINLLPILSNIVSATNPKLIISFKQAKYKFLLTNSNILIKYYPNNIHLISNFYLIHNVNKYYLEHTKNKTSTCTVTFDNFNHFLSFHHISITLEKYYAIKRLTCTFYNHLNKKQSQIILKPIKKLFKQNDTGMMTFDGLETVGNNNWIFFKNRLDMKFEFESLLRPEFCYVLLTCKKTIM